MALKHRPWGCLRQQAGCCERGGAAFLDGLPYIVVMGLLGWYAVSYWL